MICPVDGSRNKRVLYRNICGMFTVKDGLEIEREDNSLRIYESGKLTSVWKIPERMTIRKMIKAFYRTSDDRFIAMD